MYLKNKQSGYLLEIPLFMMLAGILLAIFLPLLPKIMAKILLLLGALVWIAGSFYMLITPGWQPDSYTNSRLRFPWNWLAFIAISTFVAFITGMYIWHG